MNLRSDPDRQCADGRGLHQGQCRQARGPARPRPDRGRTLYRAFPRLDRREPADRAGRQQPADARAAAIFPSAARANPTIFYDGRGNARSAGDVYRTAGRPLRCGAQRPGEHRRLALATVGRPPLRRHAPDSRRTPRASPRPMRPRRACRRRPRLPKSAPVFHGLFRSSGGPSPVAPLVNSLWTSPTAGRTAP